MKLFVISSPDKISNEADHINALFAEGLSVFHLRKPTWTEEQMDAIISDIQLEFHSRVAIHSHHVKAKAWKINRLHFPERERTKHPLSWFSEFSDVILSTSIHHHADILKLKNAFSYAFCGPVFQSISKPGYASDEWDNNPIPCATQTKLIALGGINADNIHSIPAMGFHGAAVLGAIWNAENPLREFKTIRDAVNKTATGTWTV